MQRVWFFLLVSFWSLHLFANVPVDTNAVNRTKSLLEKATQVFFRSPDSSQYFSKLALAEADRFGLPLEKARALHSLARTEILKGDIEIALTHLRDAIGIFEKEHHTRLLGKSYSLMSVAVGKINKHSESVRYLLEAEKLHLEINDSAGLRNIYVNLSNTYTKLNQYDKALEALNRSKIYLKPNQNDWFYFYINAGIIHENKNNYSLAKTQFDSSLAIARRFQMIDAEVTAATMLARLFYTTKNYAQAETYFQSAIRMARAHHLPLEEADALEGLLNYYVALHDYKNAYFSKLRLNAISDSLFNIEKIKNIGAVEAKLNMSEKEKTIALQKLEMAKSVAEKEEGRRQLNLFIVGSAFLALVLLLTLYVYVKTRRQKQEVEKQKARAEKLNSLNQKIFAVIAHDFKSPMITLNMLLDLMENNSISTEELRAYSGDVRHQLIQSGQILENLLNWARSELKLSSGNGQLSDPRQVTEEIMREMALVSGKKNLQIRNEVPADLRLNVPPDILKIIIRNLLSNAIKFSFSGGEIVVGRNNEQAIYVKDNGRGINEHKINQLFNGTVKSELGTFNETGFGLGLYITHELVHKFNGRISVESAESSGTLFKFVFKEA